MNDTVENFLARITQAWNNADAAAYAREFTEDATYVIFLGDALRGREEIERTHHDVLTKWQRGTKLVVEPVAVTELDRDVATVLTVGGIGADEPIEHDKFQTFTLVRRDGRWRCAAFQNTEMSDRAKRMSHS
ncbi:SgcJ/EcaC family oxidoreductase [Kutzneria sp. CA-103260]|uniref:SgcJ/EcaC family oxidoreductase n=1 Tax=Kutzneria sp. CA-103260 TaxID=2802641 RepID=UPI001BA94168|nr:SgcJ/EcaC family oxidoreductase [Kutzneria sp. CA-103260]QUQ64806.1 SgcJ/EcaC family oxidoreductase [Kutzneria sp. CA-103260]